MPATRIIAERCVDLLKPSGERVSFRVKFGPIRAVGQDFRCRVRFHGWGNSPPDIWGYDSLQAFSLAVGLVHSILVEFVRNGGRVLWPATSNNYDLSAFLLKPMRAGPVAAPNRRRAGQSRVRKRRKSGGR